MAEFHVRDLAVLAADVASGRAKTSADPARGRPGRRLGARRRLPDQEHRLPPAGVSSWDEGILEWTRPRQTRVVSVNGDFPGASATVRYPHDDVDAVRLLTETLVPELVAAHLWVAASPL